MAQGWTWPEKRTPKRRARSLELDRAECEPRGGGHRERREHAPDVSAGRLLCGNRSNTSTKHLGARAIIAPLDSGLAQFLRTRSGIRPSCPLSRPAREMLFFAGMTTPAPDFGRTRIDLGWTAPARPFDAGAARRGILQQHEWIRVVLGRSGEAANARLDGGGPAEPVVAAIGELRSAMIAHLAFEESVLLPLLRDDLPLGPQRADRLLDEHTRQRAMLDAIFDEAGRAPELHTLAAKLACLADWLYADMLEEERSLIISDVVRDDPVVVDQTCG